ncbi:MAG: hypothetical protein MUP97_09070 [Acidimicrobiia bacterium]|jgi:hypothetical protein|nr:hypothetical protein [Acidimicrobiia bacterium]
MTRPGSDAVAGGDTPEEIEFEADGSTFVLRVSRGASGLRGQVFRGEERIAGVQIYHSDDPELLVREARRDRAVLRAASGG